MRRIGLLATALVLAGFTGADAQHAHSAYALPAAKPTHNTGLLRQLEEVREATVRYQDIKAAQADGFVRFGRVEGPLMGEHWYRRDLLDQPLDLRRPSTLQYAVIRGERVLVGVAYTVYQKPGDPLPEGFAGEEDHWHVHDLIRLARAATQERPLLRWLVNRRIEQDKVGREGGRTRLVMLHAWVWMENPDGVFANQHRVLPYLRA